MLNWFALLWSLLLVDDASRHFLAGGHSARPIRFLDFNSGSLLCIWHAISSVGHLTNRISFYFEFLGILSHHWSTSGGAMVHSGFSLGALRSPWGILVHLEVAEIAGRHIGPWARSLPGHGVASPVGVQLDFHWAKVFVCRENISHVSAVIARIVYTWARNILLMSTLINESIFAWGPICRSRIWNCGDAVLAVLINFDALTVVSRTWNVILYIRIDRFYIEVNSKFKFAYHWLLWICLACSISDHMFRWSCICCRKCQGRECIRRGPA